MREDGVKGHLVSLVDKMIDRLKSKYIDVNLLSSLERNWSSMIYNEG